MKEKLSTFQIILFVVLGFAIIIGVLIFSFQRSKSSIQTAPVTMWGTLPESIIRELSDKINEANRDSLNLTYIEIPQADFESRLIEALASGTGPDLVVMNDDLLIKHENKLAQIPYESYPQRTFKDTFIQAGDILLRNDGISGLPWIIDPLVLYYNKSILNAEGIAVPPKYWDEILKSVPVLAKTDTSFAITRAVLPFGEFRNVRNVKDMFATLVMQAGNPIVTRNYAPTETFERTEFISTFSDRLGFTLVPAEAALTFFTQFSNPSKASYSWNRALPDSQDMFLSGDLVYYPGFASEYRVLQQKNPNLNFDVTMIPQSRNSTNEKITYGDLYFIGLVKNSPNVASAFGAAYLLTTAQNITLLSDIMKLPPVHRAVLSEQTNNAALQVFNASALIAKPFVDPSAQDTTRIWGSMVESIVSGRSNESDAVLRADSEFEKFLK